jgi:hypothetical protein
VSKNKGGREVRKPKQDKKPKAQPQATSAVFSRAADKGKAAPAK